MRPYWLPVVAAFSWSSAVVAEAAAPLRAESSPTPATAGTAPLPATQPLQDARRVGWREHATVAGGARSEHTALSTRAATLWLTDTPPQRDSSRSGYGGDSGKSHGEAQGQNQGGRPQGTGASMANDSGDRTPTKQVWLRQGGNPQTARPASGGEATLLLAPDGSASELAAESQEGPYRVRFPTPELGYYSVHFIRRSLEGGVLAVQIAKAEVPYSGMGHGAKIDPAVLAPKLDSRVPLEIVRERGADEGLFTRINYGDPITFQVLHNGQPVPEVQVTFTSGQGWSSTLPSGADGRATFSVIRDYYPDSWQLFDKRHRETFLATVRLTRPEAGEAQGAHYDTTRYTASLAGAYYPGVADYESYSNGLMLGVLGLLFSGSAIGWFRQRRTRPYQEVHFDD